jgi:hypothetical protein
MVQYVQAVLRNALESSLRDELVAPNVAKLIKVKTPTYDVGRGLTIEQARGLLQAAKGDRLQALYVPLFNSVCALPRCSVFDGWTSISRQGRSRSRRHQRVEGQLRLLPPKTKHSKRTVPLPTPCVEPLKSHRVAQDRERLAKGQD